MTTINSILDIGRLGLQAQQIAMQVTGNNVSNVNTPGYTRERVNLATNPTIDSVAGPIGTGVIVDNITRVYDRFVNAQLDSATQDLGRWETQKNTMQRVEMVFNESSGYGLNQAMSDFWNAWQDVSNNPSGSSERSVLLAKTKVLANTFQSMRSNLTGIQDDNDTALDSTVSDVNTIASQINALNSQIVSIENNGYPANAERDQRTLLLNNLAKDIDYTSTESADGHVTVTLADGNQLIGNNPYGKLTTVTDATTGHKDLVWDTAPGTVLNGTIQSGSIKSLIDTRDNTIAGYVSDLDNLAGTIISQVNSLHTSGYDLTGTQGLDFFTGTNASDIALNSTISADPNRVAAASDAAGVPGGAGNARAIAALQTANTMSGGTATFDDAFNATVGDVGVATEEANSFYNFQDDSVNQLKSFQDSASGVSIDEEMINMLQYEKAYQASAKMITTVNDMMTSLLNM